MLANMRSLRENQYPVGSCRFFSFLLESVFPISDAFISSPYYYYTWHTGFSRQWSIKFMVVSELFPDSPWVCTVFPGSELKGTVGMAKGKNIFLLCCQRTGLSATGRSRKTREAACPSLGEENFNSQTSKTRDDICINFPADMWE